MFIKNKRDLEIVLDRWQQSTLVGLDTEFIRERTYFPQLCLVQIGITENNKTDVYALDTIALESCSESISQVLAEWQGTVIAHSMSQDVEILANTPWLQGEHWFDTQVAAALLGTSLQIGYGAIVEDILGVSLDKGASRTDWAQRPLSEAQLRYALDDVRYLHALEQTLSERLSNLKREAWASEDSNRLFEKSRAVVPSDKAYTRLKGFLHHPPHIRKRARFLAKWREERAIQRDRPRGWILKDDALWQIAINGANDPNVPSRVQKPIAEVIHLADEASPCGIDTKALAGPPTADEKTKMTEIKVIVNQKATELAIESNVLLTRSEIDQIACGTLPDRLINGWRGDVLIDELNEYLPQNGEKS